MDEGIIKMTNANIWKIIHSYFHDNPSCLVAHHLESYNDFFNTGIYQIFREKNPIRVQSDYDETIGEYRNQCIMYLGGKEGTRLKFGKPIIYDSGRAHYMYPNEARLRNMTYAMTIHYDIEVEYVRLLREGESPEIVAPPELAELIEGGFGDEDEDDDYNGGSGANYKQTIAAQKKAYIAHKELVKDLAEKGEMMTERTIGGEEFDEAKIIGGAKVDVGELKKPAKKKTRTLNAKLAKITAVETAALREETEKSVVSPGIQKHTVVLENIYLGKFPIMVQSDFCILNGLNKHIRFGLGECKNDLGGYFIIDGKEKVVIPQEKFADNMLYIREYQEVDNLEQDIEEVEEIKEKYLYSAEIRSVSENASKPIRTLSVKIAAPSKLISGKNIEVNIPNVRKPVPLFIVFRALGILSDKQIIKTCLLDIEKYQGMMDLFIPSIHEAGGIMTQRAALRFIAILTKGKTIPHALEILCDYFLPHVGENNYLEKAYYLGYMVFRLLKVYLKIEEPTNRDNFKYKRIEPTGTLIYDLFREYMTIYQKEIQQGFEQRLNANQGLYAHDLPALIRTNMREVFSFRALDQGFKKAFKGNWGAYAHTKRIGVVQDLNRLSFLTALNHLRKTSLNLDTSVKLVGPRVLLTSQWGYFDPIDTPDGANIGLHKHLSIATYITRGMSREPLVEWLREKVALKPIKECSPETLSKMTRVIVNGYWAGSVENAIACVNRFKLWRRNALLPIFASVMFDIKQNTIFMYCDAGRLTRPVFYKDIETGKFSFVPVMKQIESEKFTWDQLITGFSEKREKIGFDYKTPKIYEINELYDTTERNPAKLIKAAIDYIDTAESEDMLIALNIDSISNMNKNRYTHLEIHESLIMSVMCNLIAFPQNNPATRNAFSCGQSKQAVSMYHTNYNVRMDKSAVVLNSGTNPIVKTQFYEHICDNGNPYGENVIVAIMCYTGYNMEDSVLVNEGSLKRGLFRTTYFSTYETHEEVSDKTNVKTVYTNIEDSMQHMIGLKPSYEYNHLDKNGLIVENTPVHDKMILIGMSQRIPGNPMWSDASKGPKKGQLGFVDKAFMTEGEEGQRIAKVRVREERSPAIGDKLASRAGQKGTVGLVIPEENMPFTKSGIRPDLIINPHAIPSRMTICQFVECLTGKAGSIMGAHIDATAFNNRGSKNGVFGEILTSMGYHSSGEEVFYNGFTGEQIEANVFVGPTYYMRLKHMVKDKVNYRALGPRSALTRQTVGGRANDGGLRIGEMERDGIVSHGATAFLTEAMMERGDKYYMAVCNQTGMIAAYNPSQNLFMSPMADGPLKYIGSFNNNSMQIVNITRFGRSFSVIRVPYTLKLLMHELQCANVAMRIITEENLKQIENMSFSKNIEVLSGVSGKEPIKQIIEMNRVAAGISEKFEVNLFNRIETQQLPMYEPSSPDMTPPTPPPVEYDVAKGKFIPSSPDMSPPRPGPGPGFIYNPVTDRYEPNLPRGIPPRESPEYVPVTPPGYNPITGKFDNDVSASDSYTPPPSPPYATSPGWVPKIGGSGSDEYRVGDSVMVRGDMTQSVYTIKNMGDKYITIETSAPGKGEDSIKVVDANEIYPATEYRPDLHSMADPMFDQNLLTHGTRIPTMYEPPKETIQFNPVIVVGDNNATTTAGQDQSQGQGQGQGLDMSKPLLKTSPTIGSTIKTDTTEKSEEKPKEEKKSGGGWFDFLTVKKV